MKSLIFRRDLMSIDMSSEIQYSHPFSQTPEEERNNLMALTVTISDFRVPVELLSVINYPRKNFPLLTYSKNQCLS